jgi:hypothetical protein
MRRFKLTLAIVSSCLIALAVAAPIGASGASSKSCGPSFAVLHNDQIGTMKIPAGHYTLTPVGVTCANAAILMNRFLADFDGILPGGWVINGTNGFYKAGTSETLTFKAGAIKPSNTTNNGQCAGTFTVLHNDRIGALSVPAGQYKITTKGLLCWYDTQKFAYFLNYDYAGKLPKPWSLNVAQKRFTREAGNYFSIKRVSSSTGGGGTYPNNAVTCPSLYKVGSPASLNGINFAAGSYYINVFSSVSCSQASSFLSLFFRAGAAPESWIVVPETGTFLQGNGTSGFQVEPAR